MLIILQLKIIKLSHFLSPKRISEWEFEPRCGLKMKTSRCSVGAFIEEVLRTNSAELFCSNAFSLNPCLLHSSRTCSSRDVLRAEGILPRTSMLFVRKELGVEWEPILGTSWLFCLISILKVYLFWSILDQREDMKALWIFFHCFVILFPLFFLLPLQLLCGQPWRAFNALPDSLGDAETILVMDVWCNYISASSKLVPSTTTMLICTCS